MLSAWISASSIGAGLLTVAAAALSMLTGGRLRRWILRGRAEREFDPMRPSARRVDEFLADLRAAVQCRDDEVRLVGVVPGRLNVILEVDGQETPLPIRPMLECWVEDRAGVGLLLQHIVEEIREDGLDRADDFDLAELATDILPQIRTLDWVRSHSPAFGDGRIVSREIGPELVVCYVIDDTWSMVFVCEAHLRRWGLSEADVFGLSRRNLAQRTDDETVARLRHGQPLVLRSADGYAAARVLLLDAEHAGEDLLVALPDRDVLWIGDQASQPDLADLMSRTEEECAHASHPVSPSLFRVGDEGLKVVGPT